MCGMCLQLLYVLCLSSNAVIIQSSALKLKTTTLGRKSACLSFVGLCICLCCCSILLFVLLQSLYLIVF